jgi:hypothetical protein
MDSPVPEDGLATPMGMRNEAVSCGPLLPPSFFFFFEVSNLFDIGVGSGGVLGGSGSFGIEGEPPPMHMINYSVSFC